MGKRLNKTESGLFMYCVFPLLPKNLCFRTYCVILIIIFSHVKHFVQTAMMIPCLSSATDINSQNNEALPGVGAYLFSCPP